MGSLAVFTESIYFYRGYYIYIRRGYTDSGGEPAVFASSAGNVFGCDSRAESLDVPGEPSTITSGRLPEPSVAVAARGGRL